MTKFLIEVPHLDGKSACMQITYILRTMGSYYFSHCDWSSVDGDRMARLTVEVDSLAEALRIVPPMFRKQAHITRLTAPAM